jgi:hypothetical protein
MKLCECGCGKPAPIAKKTDRHCGHVAGQPVRFCKGHSQRGRRFYGHGLGKSPEYVAYRCAIKRCSDSSNARYGGRGIKFLFERFEFFLFAVGYRPEGKDARGRALYSLDRKNNDGNYESGNVRWATAEEQAANRRPRKRTV